MNNHIKNSARSEIKEIIEQYEKKHVLFVSELTYIEKDLEQLQQQIKSGRIMRESLEETLRLLHTLIHEEDDECNEDVCFGNCTGSSPRGKCPDRR